jgi:signal transduction histidine kinase
MKHSIRRQFTLIFIALMTGTILLCFFLNSTLLEKYYVQNKKSVLLKAYNSINTASSTGSANSDDFKIEVQKISGIYNINILIINADSEPVTSSVHDYNLLTQELLDNVFGTNTNDKNQKEVLDQNDFFTIQNSYDKRTGINYIEMWGFLDNGYPFIMRTAMEGIQESANIANRFLAYSGILSVILSCIIIMMVTRKITNPIMQLANISGRMTELDFEARYTGKEKNEIGLLGKNMNQMSDKLAETISELKTANNELKKDIEKKEQIDAMRQEFLSNVSHELKTPIALVMGYAEGLKMEVNEDPESREFYCDVIMDEAQKMDVLVKKLLTLNQLEFGNDVVTMERFDMTELIKNYLASATILIQQSEAQVQFEQNEPMYVWGDEFKVEEVFMNYFTNALHYIGREKRIRISIEQRENSARISVFNTGEPIPDECIPYLWDKFYKVDKARSREYGGSGVGLSIVKAIMESMNQPYGVENVEGGVEFWFELECK